MSPEVAERYLSSIGAGHRERLGQFFTPQILARFMCRWVLEGESREIFDPAFGLGAFFSAAKEIDPGVKFEGAERDEKVLRHFLLEHPDLEPQSLRLRQENYLSGWGQKHSAIVCNPPYMRFQNFLERDKVIPEFERRTGLKLSGYTNMASVFLLKSLAELNKGGRLAYLMPLEFLNTGYGEIVKQTLIQEGRLKALIRIEPESEVFPDAITSVGIVLVSRDSKNDTVRFCTVSNLIELERELAAIPGRDVPLTDLRPEGKWLPHFDEPQRLNRSELQPISLYGTFSRGIATGANEFFVLSRSQAEALKLPRTTLRMCITRSPQIGRQVLTDADVQRLVENDERVFLVDLGASDVSSVRDYISFGEAQGFNERYLTRMRKPWYKLENRRPAPILFGVFSRDGFKVIRNTSSAISLTCFHCFYVNLFGARFVDHLFLYLCSPAGRKILSMEARKYGDKLDKFEPGDLNDALVPTPKWFSTIPDAVVKRQLERLACDKEIDQKVAEMFDSLL